MSVLFAAACVGMAAMPPGCGPKPTTQPASAPAEKPAVAPRPADPAGGEVGDPAKCPGTIYTVQSGDTLYSLAERYYGSSKYWRKIWTANRNRLANPNDVPVGMKLIIPP